MYIHTYTANGAPAEESVEVMLNAELFVHESHPTLATHHRKKRRKKQRGRGGGGGEGTEGYLPECRIMALTSLPLSEVTGEDNHTHFLAAGCSDGLVRYMYMNNHLYMYIYTYMYNKPFWLPI